MQSSPDINEIAGALALAQSAMSFAAKDSTNPHFKSRYADLYSVLDAVRPHLSAQGIAIVQIPSCIDGKVAVETRLLHKSGQWIGDGGGAWATCRDMSPQSVGSAETYGRRYGLMALCGIAPADDDGEAAQGRPQPAPPKAAPVRQPDPKPEPKDAFPDQHDGVGQVKEVRALVTAIKERAHPDRLKDLTLLIQAYCSPTRDAQGKITAYVGTVPADPAIYKTLCTKLADFK